MRAMLLSLILVGCGGVSEDKFHERYADHACGLIIECAGETTGFFDSVETCEAFVLVGFSLVSDECDYDAGAAKDCLAAVEDVTCEEYDAAGVEACAGVYSGGVDCEMFSDDTSTYGY